jgi:HemY protein
MRWAGRQATRGYIALAEGNLVRGERLLTRHARRSGAPLLNYLAAARLAHMQDDKLRRDGWLQLALQQEPAAADAVLLMQAEMLQEDRAFDQALAVLGQIHARNPKHGQALKLMGEIYGQKGDWDALAALLPELRASPRIPAESLQRWTVAAISALLQRPGLDQPGVEKLWDQVPRTMRREPALVLARVHGLIRCGAIGIAETDIRRQLRDAWDAELIRLYGELPMPDVAQHLKNAEAFLKERPEDPDLLLAVGRLSFTNQLWGKARSYLETSLAIRPSPQGYQALGQLMQRVGDREAAARAFQRGLSLETESPAGAVARLGQTKAGPDTAGSLRASG